MGRTMIIKTILATGCLMLDRFKLHISIQYLHTFPCLLTPIFYLLSFAIRNPKSKIHCFCLNHFSLCSLWFNRFLIFENRVLVIVSRSVLRISNFVSCILYLTSAPFVFLIPRYSSLSTQCSLLSSVSCNFLVY